MRRRLSSGGKLLALLPLIVGACSPSQPAGPTVSPLTTLASAVSASPAAASPSPSTSADLPADQIAALNSLTLVDEYPLYTMTYHRSYGTAEPDAVAIAHWDAAWACSLFAALADRQAMVYGRNFDWDFSPALLLFYTPDDGYASVSMVDIEFLGYTSRTEKGLASAPLAERQQLLNAPALAFDGMNSRGLVVAMAAVPVAIKVDEPQKPTIGSIGVIREMLDHAAGVDEAVRIIQSYNVSMGGGPAIHWLVADASGKAALLEFSHGKLVVTPNEKAWHLATNFVRAEAGDDPESQCWRYAKLSEKLAQSKGSLSSHAAMDLLSSVTQPSTQWSVVYQMSTGDVQVAMGRDYQRVHTFHLTLQP